MSKEIEKLNIKTLFTNNNAIKIYNKLNKHYNISLLFNSLPYNKILKCQNFLKLIPILHLNITESNQLVKIIKQYHEEKASTIKFVPFKPVKELLLFLNKSQNFFCFLLL